MTVAQFLSPDGFDSPHPFKRRGKRREQSTFDHHAQSIRAFKTKFGDRLLKGGIDPFEAEQWSDDATENHVTSAIAMFNHARSKDRLVSGRGGLVGGTPG